MLSALRRYDEPSRQISAPHTPPSEVDTRRIRRELLIIIELRVSSEKKQRDLSAKLALCNKASASSLKP